MSHIIEERYGDSYSRWNMDLAIKFMSKRRTFENDVSTKPVNHELLGKKFRLANFKTVTIVTVVRHWWAGFYFLAVHEDENGSSGVVVIENINSMSEEIKTSFSFFKQHFKPVE